MRSRYTAFITVSFLNSYTFNIFIVSNLNSLCRKNETHQHFVRVERKENKLHNM